MRISLFFLAILIGWMPVAHATVPEVIATIRPLHSIAANVMAGVGMPQLLLKEAVSPHSYVLRPSDVRRLQHAELVFRIGPKFEVFLNPAIQSLRKTTTTVVTLEEAPGLHLLPSRGLHGDEEDTHHHAAEDHDPHIWLNPENVAIIAQKMAEVLASYDPENGEKYHRNATALIVRLMDMQKVIEAQLVPVHGYAFFVYHDAYQYFEQAFGLKNAGIATLHPGQPLSVRRLHDLREQKQEQGVVCLFAEWPFPAEPMEMLAEKLQLRTAMLDPLGLRQEPGEALIFELYQAMADAFTGCLISKAADTAAE